MDPSSNPFFKACLSNNTKGENMSTINPTTTQPVNQSISIGVSETTQPKSESARQKAGRNRKEGNGLRYSTTEYCEQKGHAHTKLGLSLSNKMVNVCEWKEGDWMLVLSAMVGKEYLCVQNVGQDRGHM